MPLDGKPGSVSSNRRRTGTIGQGVYNINRATDSTVRIRIGEVIITVTVNDP
ncbi:MAG: hypothetical protein FWC29_01780 [Methanomassiliicoccaceae archaeon]|nr:hypothetical protein [Methanomassiliicoccaceae archaeon]